jgi:hypothetical protein
MTAAVVSPTRITCVNAAMAKRFVRSAHTSSSSERPSTTLDPTGRCIQELATMMKKADAHVPSAKSQIVARWTRRESLSQPKIQSPRNVDSSMNAARPSIASGAPNTSPTYVE